MGLILAAAEFPNDVGLLWTLFGVMLTQDVIASLLPVDSVGIKEYELIKY